MVGCNCEGETIVGGSSALLAQPTVLDLGRVYLGASAEASLTLTVAGSVPVTFVGRFEGGDASGFRAGPAAGRILAGASLQLTAQFVPRTEGERATTIIIDHDAADSDPLVIELRAVGVYPPDCEDGNGCTEDYFDVETGRCVHEAMRVACDDFNACTQNDTCVDGICLGESLLCDDGDVCTDDVCDPQQGCLHLPTVQCDDGNPCTRDFCDANRGCNSEVLEDGTPCEDFEQCTVGDICVFGQCRGVNVEDGTVCDDFDPCSKMDQCLTGICQDPDYHRATPGEMKFVTELGPLALGAPRNPIVDRDSTVFVGTSSGVAAIDQCGDIRWTNDMLGEPDFQAAASLPGLVSVPIGGQIVDIDTLTGAVVRQLDVSGAFSPVATASTATVSIQILDVALRASGGLVLSLHRTVSDPPSQDGLIAEVDPTHSVTTGFRPLGDAHARRLAIDADEGVIALVASGPPGPGLHTERLIRFGLAGLPETTWSTSPVEGVATDLAIGSAGDVLWTAGLLSFSRQGAPSLLLPAPLDPTTLEAGAPVLGDGRIYMVVRRDEATPGPGAAPGGTFSLLAITATTGATAFERQLPGRAVRMAPAVDFEGNVFVVIEDGVLLGFEPDGSLLYRRQLPVQLDLAEAVSVTLTPEGVVIAVFAERIYGMQSTATLGASSWPRHRRDNLSTGHR